MGTAVSLQNMGSDQITKLVVGTRNHGKISELRELFGKLPVDLAGLDEFGVMDDVEETGATFFENAVIKARAYSNATGLPAIADDSGLAVDALDGAPGVLSARYAGEDTSFPEKICRLLKEVEASGAADRSAQFVCAMAVADKNGEIIVTAEGICHGKLASEPRGSGGFGYDPIFVPSGYHETFGQLSSDIKQEISHRALAAKKIIRYLLDFIEV
jgi:XTP/dITP diphosphohydrolase